MKRSTQYLIIGAVIMTAIISLLLLFSLSTTHASFSTLPEFQTLVNRSNTFAKKIVFPTHHNRIATIAAQDSRKQAAIVKHANNTHPIAHTKIIQLIDAFLAYKKENGSTVEKKLYASLDRDGFIDRLITKRPLMFMGEQDLYLLRDGKTTGHGGFELIGTDNEKAPLMLRDYLSYDETQISALIGVCVPTYFINDGNRFNKAAVAKPGTYEPQGIYIGLVGARFEKAELMDWQHIMVTKHQNTQANGYGGHNNNGLLDLWQSVYDITFPTFDQARNDRSGRYSVIDSSTYFDTLAYKKRMALTIEPLLLQAHEHGKQQHKQVYLHCVGLGLGVWQIAPQQAQLMLDVYADLIAKHDLSHISDINFSWFPADAQSCGGVGNGQQYMTHDHPITLHFSKRNPADILQGADSGKLLVATYAWDGNSYPGNEYWSGNLTGSGDPAAACCSTIAELQNPEINHHVSAANMHYFAR